MKKITSLMLVFVLAFSLTGCGMLPKRLISAVKDRVKPNRETEATIGDVEGSLETEESVSIEEMEENSYSDEWNESQETAESNETMLSDSVPEYQEVCSGGFVYELPSSYTKNEEKDSYSNDEAILHFTSGRIDPENEDKVRSNLDEYERLVEEEILEIAKSFAAENFVMSDEYLTGKLITDSIKPNNTIGNTYHFKMSNSEGNYIIYISWMMNTENWGTCNIIGLFLEDSIYIDKYIETIKTARIDGFDKSETGEKNDNTKNETSGVDPDLKAYLDSYEAFVDEYVEFMQKYYKNPSDLSLLSEYGDMLKKMNDFSEKIDKYDKDEMSKEDYDYYIDVTMRCTTKMLKAIPTE